MSEPERQKLIKGLLRHIQAHTWEIETLQSERREFIRQVEELQREKPQVQTEALTRVVNQDANKSLTD